MQDSRAPQRGEIASATICTSALHCATRLARIWRPSSPCNPWSRPPDQGQADAASSQTARLARAEPSPTRCAPPLGHDSGALIASLLRRHRLTLPRGCANGSSRSYSEYAVNRSEPLRLSLHAAELQRRPPPQPVPGARTHSHLRTTLAGIELSVRYGEAGEHDARGALVREVSEDRATASAMMSRPQPARNHASGIDRSLHPQAAAGTAVLIRLHRPALGCKLQLNAPSATPGGRTTATRPHGRALRSGC